MSQTGGKFFFSSILFIAIACSSFFSIAQIQRQRILINSGWRFFKGDPEDAKGIFYDIRPRITNWNDNVVADTRADRSNTIISDSGLRKWILPSANDFIKDSVNHHQRPNGNPGSNVSHVQNNFDDSQWEQVDLPHDWAIKGLFYKEANAIVGGGMGRLPVHGVAWYRRKLDIPSIDKGKHIYLDIDGAMSYAMIWLNGNLVGGWPYGYNSFRLDLTPYLKPGGDNQLAIRLDNPPNSSRWYPGAGIYRNVWLTKANPVHVAQWGTFITTRNVSASSATIDLKVDIENKSNTDQSIEAVTEVYVLDDKLNRTGKAVAIFPASASTIQAGKKQRIEGSVIIKDPLLWGLPPSQKPNLYVAIIRLYINEETVDEYETRFGIRSLKFDALKGLLVNERPVRIQGVNQHHDLGALGAAFNTRAAERQLEILHEMGCNAIRMAHNPPAPELLDLTDRMGFLVIDEIFDCWERKKTPLDFHLIFPDWYEADTRAFIRRDRNHPSVIAWSFGNEVGEQYTSDTGAALAKKIYDIVREEDSTRPATASMNYARPDMPFPKVMDIISLNYQGEGIRDAPAYSHLRGIKTSPLYPAFQKAFPDKLIVSSETASALSSRGAYLFPVTNDISAPVSDSTGGDSKKQYVSAYELYTAAFGASPDKVFASQDKHPYVAGEFVWSGWDYLGEPTPYYSARSSYSGIIDLAGFKKDRFYLYQSRWRPNLPMVHMLPHWNQPAGQAGWPDSAGQITPVHVFTSGDEAELFLNGRSLGKKKKAAYEYRLRWDDVKYEPGGLKVIAYKNGKKWAEQTVKTTDVASQLLLRADRNQIKADGEDLSFITVNVADKNGLTVPDASNKIIFSIEGPGEIVATDNGNPADLVSFISKEREAFSGLALAIVRFQKGKPGVIKITASSPGLKKAVIEIRSKQKKETRAHNPVIFADVPDMSIVRIGNTYYMSSTTMHMSPGVPIMRSQDLINWKLINYAYDTLANVDEMNLENAKSTYGRGSWASSLRYHNGTFYVSTFAQTTGKTYIYTTKDIEKGPWKATSFKPAYHDHSLFFDDDGHVYMIYDGEKLKLIELKSDLSGIKPGATAQVIIESASAPTKKNIGLPAEGSQLFKINGRYYLFNITWPKGGMRTVIIHRASAITGPYEGRVGLEHLGVAQGGLIDSPEGNWYAYLFRDFGAVGRIPYLVPVQWEDGWPVLGIDGKVPETLDLPASRGLIPGIVASDDFTRKAGERALPLVWQWNHNPDNKLWSVNKRKGYLRLTTGRIDTSFLMARNTLTQRTIGPVCTGSIALDVSHMKEGDFAGLSLLQKNYGLVGVKIMNGSKTIVMVNAGAGNPVDVQAVPLTAEKVYLRATCDFTNRTDTANFLYSLDGHSWNPIGSPLKMTYTLPHFVGYRYGLFNYATKETGGYADFDFFHIEDKIGSGAE